MARTYLSQAQKFLRDLNQYIPSRIGPIAKSTGFISPGDVLIFRQIPGGRQKNYPSDNIVPVVLVVSNQRGKGIFLSTRSNMLLSSYHINHLSPELAVSIIKTLYKKRKESNYYKISASGLKAIIGDNYRTYNFDYIESINKIFIDLEKLEESQEIE